MQRSIELAQTTTTPVNPCAVISVIRRTDSSASHFDILNLVLPVRTLVIRKLVYLLLVASVSAECGCSGRTEPSISPEDAEAAAAGIGNEKQVKFVITEELQLASLVIVPAGDGSFSAIGKKADGTEYDIFIEQEPGSVNYTWSDSNGKEGKGAFKY